MKEINCQHNKEKENKYKNNFIYSKVDNDKRMVLLTMVKDHGKSLKEASNLLKINYSTAKTILRVYRIENRILKKSSNKTHRKGGKCNCNSTESKHEVHSTFDSPVKESQAESENILFDNQNSNKSELGNFSLVEKISPVKTKNETVYPTVDQIRQEYSLPVYKSPSPIRHLNNSRNLLNFSEFFQKIQVNMLGLQQCFREIDHNKTLLKNVNFLLEKIRINKMFS